MAQPPRKVFFSDYRSGAHLSNLPVRLERTRANAVSSRHGSISDWRVLEASIRWRDAHRQHVRSEEIAIKLAADVVPIVIGIEPRVHRWHERRKQ